jgi:hypothetical protein
MLTEPTDDELAEVIRVLEHRQYMLRSEPAMARSIEIKLFCVRAARDALRPRPEMLAAVVKRAQLAERLLRRGDELYSAVIDRNEHPLALDMVAIKNYAAARDAYRGSMAAVEDSIIKDDPAAGG